VHGGVGEHHLQVNMDTLLTHNGCVLDNGLRPLFIILLPFLSPFIVNDAHFLAISCQHIIVYDGRVGQWRG
jgi:hypothetical protein